MSETQTTTMNKHIVKEELFDADIIEDLLRDSQFSATIRRNLSAYKKARTHGARKQVVYSYGNGCEEDAIGRLFVKDHDGLQAYPKDIRNPLIQQHYWDVDIENCHYWLMKQFCEANGLNCRAINYYCNHRASALATVSSNRDVAKTAFLKTAYGGNVRLHDDKMEDSGEEPEGDVTLLKQIEKEIKTVIAYVKGEFPKIAKLATDKCRRKKEWADKKGKSIAWNPDYTALALVLQTEERKCLLALDEYLAQNGRQMDILIHDGGAVRKLANETQFPTELLRGAEAYIKEQLGYEVRLVNKPITHNFKKADKEADIINDEYAGRRFVELMGSNIIRENGNIYFYDTEKGMWETGDDAYITNVSKFKHKLIFKQQNEKTEKIYDYGGSTKNVMNMRKWIHSYIESTNKLQPQSSKLCLLFANGWFDMMTMTFHEGFDECREKYFTKRINRKFNSIRNSDVEKTVKKVLFENPYNNKAVGECYMNIIARAVAGEVDDRVWNTVIGNTSCGKGVISTIIKNTFDEYVEVFNMNVLKYNLRDGQDEAKKLAWYAPLIGCRVAIGNEVRMDGRGIDGNLIKSLTGGDRLKLRTNFKDEYSVLPITTFFGFCNDMPTITPCDMALKRRMTCIPHTKSFVEKKQEDCNEYEMEADMNLKRKIEMPEWVDAFFWLIAEAYNGGVRMERPQELIQESDELFVVEDDKLKQHLEERFEFVPTEPRTEENYVRFSVLREYINEANIKMSDTKIGRELKKLGLIKVDKKVDKRTVTVYYGLKE